MVQTFHLITPRCDSAKITRTPSFTFRHLSPRRKNVVNQYLPSKHAGSDPHPIRIGSEALARSGPDDSWTPACFWTGSVWPNLTQSARIKSDPGRFCTICGRTQQSLKWEIGSGPVVLYQKLGQMIPAHRLVSRPDAFGHPDRIWVVFEQYGSCLL